MENIEELEINGVAYRKTDIQHISMPDKMEPYWEIIYKDGMIIWATGAVTIVAQRR